MGNSYTRQSSFSDGDTINSGLFNDEYDQLVLAFSSSVGHTHDGSAGEAGAITVVGPAQDIIIAGTTVLPKTTNAIDLGSSTFKFKDAYFGGNITADGSITYNGNVVLGSDATDTVTINGTIQGGSLLFEGATADAFETTLAIPDATSDITITLPNATDTLVGKATTDTLTNKTLTSPTLNTPTITGNTTFSDGAYNFDIASHDTVNGLKLGGTLVTSTAAELNILDGVTATATELNLMDGVTATTAELNILDGVTSTATEINLLDGVTSTTAELNYLDGVTSAIQTQLDGKSATSHNHTGVYEPADATILKDADIGVNVQAYDANLVSDATYVATDENFTTADHSKLDGIEASANNYTHPANHAISVITGLQTALDGKVDDSQVLTDVPSGAVFTDTETTTTLSLATNILSYVDELGATTNLDLSLYLDDTNLAYIASGALNGSTGIATFTRSDASTFTVDLSALLDDTSVTVNNTLTSTSTTEALSANQGKVLKGLADGLETRVALNDAKVSNVAHPLVETAVPTGAVFTDTDTIYTHPTGAGNLHVPTAGTVGQVLTNTASGTGTWQDAAGGVNLTSATTAPASPSTGDQWFDTANGILYAYMTDGTDSQWLDISSANGVAATSTGGGAMELISTTTVSTAVASIDFTSIGSYTSWRIIASSKWSSGIITALKFFDNGSLITGNNYSSWRSANYSAPSVFDNGSYGVITSLGIQENYTIIDIHMNDGRPYVKMHVTGKTATSSSTPALSTSSGFLIDGYTLTSLTGFSVTSTGGNCNSGTFSLYGIKDS